MMFSLFGICTKTLHRPPIGQVERGMCVRRNNSRPAPRPLSPPPSPCACIPPLSPIYHLPLCEASLCNPGRPHPPSWALSVTYRLHRPHLPPCWQCALSPIPGLVAWFTAWNEIWEQLALNLDCNLTSRASSFRSGEAVR